MLPVSMCYAGSPCGTLKCALLTAITMPNRSANFILLVNSFDHAFGTVRGLGWHPCLYVHPRQSGDYFSCVGVDDGDADRFLLDPHIPLPIPEPSPSFRISPTPLPGLHLPPLSEFYPPLFYELCLHPLSGFHLPPLSEFYPPPFYEFYPPPLNSTHPFFLYFTPSPSDSSEPPDPPSGT